MNGVLSDIKSSLLAGLIVILPIAAVAFVLNWSYHTSLDLLYPFVSKASAFTGLDFFLTSALTFALLFLGLVLAGFFFRTYIGYKVEKRIDHIFDKLPVIGAMYDMVKTTSKDVIEKEKFQDPVKVDTSGIRRTAFRTGRITENGRKILFMPTSPNITSGFVIEVSPENIIETDENSKEALEKLLSAGFGGN